MSPDTTLSYESRLPYVWRIEDDNIWWCLQEVEKEVWEKDASGKRKLKLVQEADYCYEADMEGMTCPTP